METLVNVFQTDSEEVNEVYSSQPNYLIEYSKTDEETSNGHKPYCILYFSSNDIYYPNTSDSFYSQLVKKNRFEWYGTRIQKGAKHIFLRDIKKQWYLSGINAKTNTIEKLFDFLKMETKGYRVITVGSSAGGYAAVLFGSLLGSETVFTFNGQFLLSDLLSNSSEHIDPIIFREKENPEINKYYSLRPYIKNSRILYFYSDRSPWDIAQYHHISDLDIHIIPFRTHHHGVPFLKSNLKYLINFPINRLERLANKTQYPLLFSFKIEGIFRTIISLTKQIYQLIFRKLSILYNRTKVF